MQFCIFSLSSGKVDSPLLSSFSWRMWLGNAVLAYLLLGQNYTAFAQTPPANIHIPSRSIAAGQASDPILQPNAKDYDLVSLSQRFEIVDHAISLLGIPYVFGGTSRKGFDCSGFTQFVYKGSGISLPRTSSQQCSMGSSVSRAQLQAGDLVFFHTYAAGASHVGIYIGGGRFVHAANSGVRVENLNNNYYAERYLGARRIL